MSTHKRSSKFSSELPKPTLAAAIEQRLSPKSPFSDTVSRTSSSFDDSTTYAHSYQRRLSVEEVSPLHLKGNFKVADVLEVIHRFSQLRKREAYKEKKLLRCMLQYYFQCLKSLSVQEKQILACVKLFRAVFVLDSFLLDTLIACVLFLLFRRVCRLLSFGKFIEFLFSSFCWTTVHWVLCYYCQWMYPWENYIVDFIKKYWKNRMKGEHFED